MRILFAFACTLPTILSAQSDSLVNSVGTYLGSRAQWIQDCSASLEKDKQFAGFRTDRACACMITTVLEIPQVDRSKDANILDHVDFGAEMEQDTALAGRFTRCLLGSLREDASLLDMMSEQDMQEIKQGCVDGVRTQLGDQLGGIDVDALCGCIVRQMSAHGLTADDMDEIQDPNSPLFNEVMAPCLNEAMAVPAGAVKAEVTGPEGPASVPVIAFGKVHKVKVSVGGKESYFIIDSGANDCFISGTMANDLQTSGALNESDRLPDMVYAMADGTRVSCRRYLVSGVTVGPYTVNGVVFAVVDQKNVQYLLGKSWLGQFQEWHVDAEKKMLVLRK